MGLKMNRQINKLVSHALTVNARKLAGLFGGFLSSLLYDLMQTHFMSMEHRIERAILILLIVSYVNR